MLLKRGCVATMVLTRLFRLERSLLLVPPFTARRPVVGALRIVDVARSICATLGLLARQVCAAWETSCAGRARASSSAEALATGASLLVVSAI